MMMPGWQDKQGCVGGGACVRACVRACVCVHWRRRETLPLLVLDTAEASRVRGGGVESPVRIKLYNQRVLLVEKGTHAQQHASAHACSTHHHGFGCLNQRIHAATCAFSVRSTL